MLAEQIVLDLDQNAYTTWHDQKKILAVINAACEFLFAYTQRPWTLTMWEIEQTNPETIFTFDEDILFPYRAELDWKELERTNIPIVGRMWEKVGTFFIFGDTIRTKDKWKKMQALYHRWHVPLTSLGTDDIDAPSTMNQVLLHLALWFIYPGGMDLGASLANQNYQMAQELLTVYSKAYGFDLQPSAVKTHRIYN